MVVWTAVIEDRTTGLIRTPVLQADWSGKSAMLRVQEEHVGSTEKLVCIIRGVQSQGIYPSVDNLGWDASESKR